MSSKKYAAPLSLDLGPSRSLSWLLFSLHGAGYIALWSLPLPWFIPLFGSIPMYFSLRNALGCHARRSAPTALRSVGWSANGDWRLTRTDGSSATAELLGDSFVHPVLTVLNFRIVGTRRRESAVIMRDTLAPEPFRQLRVRIKLEARNSAE